MQSVIPFQFESHSVRVIEIDGDPWFVGKDVAQVLGYAEPEYAIRTHCKGVEETSTPSAGGVQKVKIIPERDVYRLIMRSKKPEAEKFEEWVVGEVLPSIRKTGSYNARRQPEPGPQLDGTYTLLKDLALTAIDKVPGINAHMAYSGLLNGVQTAGLLSAEVIKHLAAALPMETQQQAFRLTPKELAGLAGLKSAQQVNLRLQDLGLQKPALEDQKSKLGSWVLTKAGEEHARLRPYSVGKHSGYQILWSEAVIEKIRNSG